MFDISVLPVLFTNFSFQELAQDILAAEKLASGIMTDVQSVLRDFNKSGKNREFWALIESALADMEKPKDPNRLLRLS